MNVSATTIYFWQLADRLIWAFGPLWFFSTLAFIIFAIYYLVAKSDEDEIHIRCSGTGFKFSSILASLFFLMYTLIPTSNTIAMMVVIPEIAKSKVIQTDLPDLYNAAVSALKAAIAPEKK